MKNRIIEKEYDEWVDYYYKIVKEEYRGKVKNILDILKLSFDKKTAIADYIQKVMLDLLTLPTEEEINKELKK